MRALTVPKAITAGLSCGAASILLWFALLIWPRWFVLPYVAALSATAAAGLYILFATWVDSQRRPRRGARIKPIRGFDIAVGLLLAIVSIWALRPFLPAL